ncbi:MAG TPA: hypothetical protein VK968_17660 [Roseimicrobium sp.]|nr:hypothetical protein [Roseimicrobium sp.]
MKKSVLLLALVLAAITLGSVGCKSDKGSQQFLPGRGWVPTKY